MDGATEQIDPNYLSIKLLKSYLNLNFEIARISLFQSIRNSLPIRGCSREAVRGGYLYFETIFNPTVFYNIKHKF